MPPFFKRHRFIMSGVEGFSLVEMLIYIAILALMLSVIMNIVVSTIRSERIIKVLRNVEDSAILSLERITRETRQAGSVNLNSSILGSSPGKLVLEGTDAGGNPRTVEFYLSSGKLFLKENGVDTGALTQADARISSLIFHLFSGSNSEGIRTEITIESGTSTHFRSDNFYSSTLLR
ncbi:MAG: hypothetical protein A3C70_03480 [Candidatus Zambryskibacteria bacterium RIFCSPHIGHO2_02_FULL_43_14]|uniref:Prepilin-type N-terminal cleavage/methylation domain-containing protein n=1 Tax=Candidatus Zambryskibacteria bacterium RIFCSPHIGHO2_02_FULL_43_14 TaxID=1802748 RepID=A0A1G2TFT6_9BACT|nr:MAG: hypothetical protein A2829_00925 [Candidatus Zambryskibacteria bacterium RIFCSPHIGHO2_01_FULL_43_60]OHA96147.1 MAG: hypothetical protein A3C70_03480 [Candidatus Zambryskibacteria bacterium RIFCSPHIGHO2_02_FULL_43_14]OHB03147.1 MAG: hypothetical protein A3B03_01765 [Candidatus Zambryskibacteria bacterium RIFCSPLOWO2_01_FULL_42_41]